MENHVDRGQDETLDPSYMDLGLYSWNRIPSWAWRW